MAKAQLVQLILDTAHRPDLSSAVDGFIRHAENMISRDVRAVDMIETVELTNPVQPGIYDLPIRCLEIRSLVRGSDSMQSNVELPLKQVSLDFIRRRPIPTLPAIYSIRGLKIEVRGHPATDDILTMDYFAKPESLVEDSDTNPLLERNEAVYLYAALSHLYTYTQDLELAQDAANTYIGLSNNLNDQATRMLGGAEVAPSWNLENVKMPGGY